MSDKKNYDYSLDSFADGALLEQFNMAAAQVAENIVDPNTSAKAKRKVVMELVYEPGEDREIVPVSVAVKTTLAPVKGFPARIVVERDKDGKVQSAEYGSSRNQVQMNVSDNGDVSLEVQETSAKPKLTVVSKEA